MNKNWNYRLHHIVWLRIVQFILCITVLDFTITSHITDPFIRSIQTFVFYLQICTYRVSFKPASFVELRFVFYLFNHLSFAIIISLVLCILLQRKYKISFILVSFFFQTPSSSQILSSCCRLILHTSLFYCFFSLDVIVSRWNVI